MLKAAVISHDDNIQTARLISSFLFLTGKKVNIMDSKNLTGLNTNLTKEYISELDKNNTDMFILNINIFDIDINIFSRLNFDIIICSCKADDFKGVDKDRYTSLMHDVFALLDEKCIAIINSDCSEFLKFMRGARCNAITYGFNSKASITASSIGDMMLKDSFLCCLQRTISTKNGLTIEPQEFRINLESKELDEYNILAAASFAIINGVDLNLLNNLM